MRKARDTEHQNQNDDNQPPKRKKYTRQKEQREINPYPASLPKELAQHLASQRRRLRLNNLKKNTNRVNANNPFESITVDIPIQQRSSYTHRKIAGSHNHNAENPNRCLDNDLIDAQIRDYKEFFELPEDDYELSSSSDDDCDMNGGDYDITDDDCTETIITRKMFEPWTFGKPEHSCSHCKAITWFAERNNKRQSKTKAPTFSICCQNGKVKLPSLQPAPSLLDKLIDPNGGPISAHFRDGLRRINSMFSFTSMGGVVDKNINKGKGPYVFRINGQNHHRIGSLLPDVGKKPKFSQLYFYDTEHETRNRIAAMSEDEGRSTADNDIVKSLIDMLNDINPLAKLFRMARDRHKQTGIDDFNIRLIAKRGKDARIYNLPSASEVGGLLVTNRGESQENRDIIVQSKSGPLKRITELHPSYFALQYPILFPYGEDGWTEDIPYAILRRSKAKKQRTHISFREFIAYRIQERLNEGRTLLMGGRLLQQFLVDAYTTLEESRLRFIMKNQSKIRAELYTGLKDAVINGDTNAAAVGRRLVLPATFTGGPRYMVQNYQDAIAICRWAGPPDLFITMTCNPKWPEIQELMNVRKTAKKSEDRPDAIARVFHVKIKELIEDLYARKHFGRVKAALYTIEFQKRGLPHAHILLFLHQQDKYQTSEQINKVISAELPDKDKDPLAYQAVVEFMIHGPCGKGKNEKAPCIEDKDCTKFFPKKFATDTTQDKYGYYSYRRRDNGRTATKNGMVVNNQWVVPHNVDLIVKYQCHINVEYCNQGRAMKYLFKYVHKGNTMSTVVIEKNGTITEDGNQTMQVEIDEIKRYLDCRFISASEAVWRLLGFDINFRFPKVERLPFHLEGEQQIYFDDDDDPEEVLNRQSIHETKFLEWMKTNQQHPDACELTYVQFPEKWVWKKQKRKWKRRQRGTVVGRIYFAHPTAGDRYYLRLLLNHVKGAKSYNDIKTFNGTLYEEYKDACIARGLLEDDGEWHEALKEASTWSTAKALRQMFVTMLLHCEITHPLELWNEHWKAMSEDIENKERLRRKRNDMDYDIPDELIQNIALCKIEILLNKNNKSIKDFKPLPFPDMSRYREKDNRLIEEELHYNVQQLKIDFQTYYEALNEEQKIVYDNIIHTAENDLGGLYFVYGSGGTGKTFLWKTILAKIRSQGKIALAVASSGIASLLLPGGRTAHSRFKIPLEVDEYSTCSITKKTHLAELIRAADIIIWDEAPMNHKHVFEAVDKTFRDIMEDETKIFGGKTMVLGGDFRQTLPVIPKGTREDIISASINKSYLWKHCKMFELKTNMRLRNDKLNAKEKKELAEFSDWVLQIGEGRNPTIALTKDEEKTWINLPKDLIIEKGEDPVKKMIDETFPNIERNYRHRSYIRDRCILTPTNEKVEEVNTKILSMIPTQGKIYKSADSISPISGEIQEQDILYPQESLNALNFPGMPPHSLELKIGIPIMLIRNINPSSGLCNGTRLIITAMEEKCIQAEIVTGSHVGDLVNIHRIQTSSQPTSWEFILRRRQFPIKICFAMTINKSQGQTLQNVGLFLPRPVFNHGQLYVAVSRTTSKKGLKIIIETKDGEPENHTKNIVYDEIFEELQPGTNKEEPYISTTQE